MSETKNIVIPAGTNGVIVECNSVFATIEFEDEYESVQIHVRDKGLVWFYVDEPELGFEFKKGCTVFFNKEYTYNKETLQ